ncbi:MAG: hypothetical protein S4CHLAM6_09910 [Chlamydiae bacterium]|nr:hypothetical protein [Chlamydiota bacterium]
MRKKGYLVIAGSLNFFIGVVHIITIFIGAPAYNFLDAPQLAVYTELGYMFPAWLTLIISFFFFGFGLYAFCTAGGKIKLPFQPQMLKIIGSIFVIRGFALFWYIYVQIKSPTDSSLREIVFSLFALVIGMLYWLGVRERTQGTRFNSLINSKNVL